jgi:hypothetical protein
LASRDVGNDDEVLVSTYNTIVPHKGSNVNVWFLEIAHKSIQRVYLLQNWVEAQSYWVVLSAKTANAIGLLPEERDTGNLQMVRRARSSLLWPMFSALMMRPPCSGGHR